MPEPEDSASSGLHLPPSDPAASAVEALRAMAGQQPVGASAELAAFLEDPAGQGLGNSPRSRSDLVTVVRLPIRRAGRAAVAVGAAVALAALGGVAVAATGGGQDREPAHVQQDDPSDTTTTSKATDTETTTTTTDPEDSDDGSENSDDGSESSDDGSESSDAGDPSSATHTANATASANHHDGVGADDEHADVHGGGEVDHRAEHSPTAHPTGGDDDDADEQTPAARPGGGSHRP